MLLRQIGSGTGVIPQGLHVNDVVFNRDDPLDQNSMADIYRGDRNGVALAVKKLRWGPDATPMVSGGRYLGSVRICMFLLLILCDGSNIQAFRSEVMAHAYLNHRNVLPLMGVMVDPAHPISPWIFTEWMHGGNIAQYMKTDRYVANFGAECNRLVSPVCVTVGLFNVLPCLPLGIRNRCWACLSPRQRCRSWRYQTRESNSRLVSLNVLSNSPYDAQSNILMGQQGQPMIADFGSAIMVNIDFAVCRPHTAGTSVWMAPESRDSVVLRKKPSADVFSYAAVCYKVCATICASAIDRCHLDLTYDLILQLATGVNIFHDVPSVGDAVLMVMAGERPERPYCLDNYIMPAEFFELVTDCWNHTPQERPTMREVLGYFAVGPEQIYVGEPLLMAQVKVNSHSATGM
jgi:serine/threonine protein kinase